MGEHKSTQIGTKMKVRNKLGMNMMIIKRKRKLSIPKNLNIIGCWNIVGPELSDEFENGYTHIPYFLDTSAYKIGYIFVPIESRIKCLCVAEKTVKILGPLSDFVVKDKTDEKFLNPKINLSKRQQDLPNLRLILFNKKKEIVFTGYDCQFLDKSKANAEGNITIDRSSSPDLMEAKWFGLITGAFAAESIELYSLKESFSRTTHIGDGPHTILFKYEICEINENGLVTRTSGKKIETRWTTIMEEPRDSLPVPQFISQSDRR